MSRPTRVQLELSERPFKRLTELKEKTEATSYAEVIKNALRLYEFFISTQENGKRILLQDSNGEAVVLEIL